MEKKISFGFTKISKQNIPIKPIVAKKEEKIQYIDCLDSQTIVFKNEEEGIKAKETDLIIPLKKNSNNLEEVNKKIASNEDESHTDDTATETLEQKAVKEILEGVNTSSDTKEESKSSNFVILNSKTRTEASTESTLDDYESVPIVQYGLAMLRGMGWKPEKGIGKTEKVVMAEVPQPRPRGMGLGADKLVSKLAPSTQTSKEEELKVIKGAFLQVIAGSQKGQYGQIEGFNENSGRVIVKLALQGSFQSFNEYAFKLVSKEEFNKNSRVLNASKYEEYKQRKDDKGSIDDEKWRHRTPTPEERRSPTPTEKRRNSPMPDKKRRQGSPKSQERRRRSSTPDDRVRQRSSTPEEKSRHQRSTANHRRQQRSETPNEKKSSTPDDRRRHRRLTPDERRRRSSTPDDRIRQRSSTPEEKSRHQRSTANHRRQQRSVTPDDRRRQRSATPEERRRHRRLTPDERRRRSRSRSSTPDEKPHRRYRNKSDEDSSSSPDDRRRRKSPEEKKRHRNRYEERHHRSPADEKRREKTKLREKKRHRSRTPKKHSKQRYN